MGNEAGSDLLPRLEAVLPTRRRARGRRVVRVALDADAVVQVKHLPCISRFSEAAPQRHRSLLWVVMALLP